MDVFCLLDARLDANAFVQLLSKLPFDNSGIVVSLIYDSSQRTKIIYLAIVNQSPTIKLSTMVTYLLMGEFNCILFFQEKLGGIHCTTRYITQFMHFLNQAQLLSLPCTGNSFTWCNNIRQTLGFMRD